MKAEVPPRSWAYRTAKRSLDLAIAGLLLLLFFPIILAVWLLVRLRMGSPAIFRQERAGLGGKPFRVLKFRTMTEARDADGALLPDADRLTPLGRFLRTSSLDELPQLWNVAWGDMSLVGPRPLPLRYLSRYSPEQALRHEVPPGITGLAQVSGRNALSWDDKLALDTAYARTSSFLADLSILFRTVVVVFLRRGVSHQGEATMREFMGPGGQKEEP